MSVKLNLDIPKTKKALWHRVIQYKNINSIKNLNEAVLQLLEKGLKK